MGNATENVAKQHELHSRVGHLKERIYVTFTLLAVSITLASHVPEHALEAVFTIFVTVLGSVLAALTAELLSHMILHERWLDASELREVLWGSWGALASITPSLLMVASSMLGWVSLQDSLRYSAGLALLSLILIAYMAVRNLRLTVAQQVVAISAEAALGFVVIVLELLAHH